MIRVLFLSPLYPNRYDAMPGLFVRKHAEAVSRFCSVYVLYLHPDTNIKSTEIKVNHHNNLTELIVYYPVKQKGAFLKLSKMYAYVNAYRQGYRKIKKSGFNPDIIHANILTRSVFMAYVEKLFHKTPYVITEHWSRYLHGKQAFDGNFDKWITRLVARKAAAIMPVSDILMKGMLANKIFNDNYWVVNNVVDDFFQAEKTAVISSKKRILHISCFDETAKNITGLLRAIENLCMLRNDFELVIIGTGVDFESTKNYCKTLNIPKGIVQFLGEKTPVEVAEWFVNSDLFVLFSNYETAGVVLAESLVSGVPVVSTNVGIAPEVIDESNGKIVPVGDEHALTNAINEVLEDYNKYDKEQIKEQFSKQFTYNEIGVKITEIYQKALNR